MRSRLQNKEASGSHRLITSRHGLWFTLLPRVVQLINEGDQVHVTRLIDDAWVSQHAQLEGKSDAPFDVVKAIITAFRPPAALSRASPLMHEDFLLRFSAFCDLVYTVRAGRVGVRTRPYQGSVFRRRCSLLFI